ncbi:MAG: GldG family protein [Deltaproteobacteria bacterium]|nr:GldG family protein [Deltaproteobacteria bacterium]
MSYFYQNITRNSVIVILIFGIVIAVNILSAKYHTRWDLTDEKEYTLSPASLKILDRLDDRVTVKMYYSKNLPAPLLPIRDRVDDIISEFKAHSQTSFVIEHIDPDLNEDRSREIEALGIAPLQLNVVEKDKQEVRKVYMGMVLYYQDKRQVIPAVTEVQNMEYLIGLSILNLTQKQRPRIGVFIGANQSKYLLIDKIVKQLGELVPIDASTKNLDQLNLNILLVIDPVEVTKEITNQWDTLIEKGAALLVFSGTIDVQDEDMTAFEIFSGVEDWLGAKGLGVSHLLLLDIQQNAQAGFQAGLMQVYMAYPFWIKALKKDLSDTHIITAGLEEVLFPWTNVLDIMGDKNNPWKPSVLVTSSEKSFLQQEGMTGIDPQYVDDMTELPVFKKYPLTAVLKRDNKQGLIFVTANHHMLRDGFLQQSQGNIIFLSNMIEYSSWGDLLIDVRSRGKTARPLKELDPEKKSRIKWVTTGAVPLSAIAAGLMVLWILKKRRGRRIHKLLT